MRKHGSRRTVRGQVTIPRDLREQLCPEPGDEVRFTSAPAGLQLEKAPRQSVFDRYRGCLPHLRGEDAVELTRNRRGPVR
jgi:bifunctional DNA-binding transcriptional regulator/antitoxin component of YhaV-PrlF toxin-antitoxin module